MGISIRSAAGVTRSSPSTNGQQFSPSASAHYAVHSSRLLTLERIVEMIAKLFSPLCAVAAAGLMLAIPPVYAQTASSDFATEPDKSMAEANEAYAKGDNNKAAEALRKASSSVKKTADQVA